MSRDRTWVLRRDGGQFLEPARSSFLAVDLSQQSAYPGSALIVRKTAETTLTWPVPTYVSALDMEPKGELLTPP